MSIFFYTFDVHALFKFGFYFDDSCNFKFSLTNTDPVYFNSSESNNAIKKLKACMFRTFFILIFSLFLIFIQYTPVNFKTFTVSIIILNFIFIFFFLWKYKKIFSEYELYSIGKNKLKCSQVRKFAIKWFVLFIDSVFFKLLKNVLTRSIPVMLKKSCIVKSIYCYCFAFSYFYLLIYITYFFNRFFFFLSSIFRLDEFRIKYNPF